MKKIVSLILAVALIATLAVAASADVVVHNQCNEWCTAHELEHGVHEGVPTQWWHPCALDASNGWSVRVSGWQTKIVEAPEDMELTWTTCAQALTVAQMKQICEDNEDINNLTVFYQRNVTTAGGSMTVRLWPCDPAHKDNQSVVVLYQAEGGEWSVLVNQFGQKDATVELPAGTGAFAVCLAW